jgi:hypothetical protein
VRREDCARMKRGMEQERKRISSVTGPWGECQLKVVKMESGAEILEGGLTATMLR